MATYIPRSFGGTLVLGLGSVLTQITPNVTLYVRSGIQNIGARAVPTGSYDYSPIYVGDTGAVFAPQLLHKLGSTAVNLTGAQLSTRMTNQFGVTKIWNASMWVISDPTNGLAYYPYQATDVDTFGTWTVQVEIVINNQIMHADPVPLQIIAAV